MIGTFISAAILAATLHIVARHDADVTIPKMILIAFGVSISMMLLGNVIGIFAIPIVLAALGWALVRFCYISIPQAAIVCGVWLVAQVVLGIVFATLFGG